MPQSFWKTPYSTASSTANCISSNSAHPNVHIHSFFPTPQLHTSRTEAFPLTAEMKGQLKSCCWATPLPMPSIIQSTGALSALQGHFIIHSAEPQHACTLSIKHLLTRLPFLLAAFWRILKDFFLSCSACSYLKTIIVLEECQM